METVGEVLGRRQALHPHGRRVAWSLPTVRISDCRSLYDLLAKDGVAAAERRLTLDEAIKESAEHMEPEAAILV